MHTVDEQELLDALAACYGIAQEYYDIFGRRHPTSNDTKRAILAVMGVRTDTAEHMRRELDACREAVWQRACDPVLVVPDEGGGNGWPETWSFRMQADEGEECEIRITWTVRDESGKIRRRGNAGPGLVPVEVHSSQNRRYVRFELPVPTGLGIGYYELGGRGVSPVRCVEGRLRLILIPRRCYLPAFAQNGKRIWGLALQLYALRSSRNWGVGDLGDLAALVEWAAKDLKAGVIGLNPLHALKNEPPYHISPYSPDSRLFLNTLYLDVQRVPEFQESVVAQQMVNAPEFQALLEGLRTSERVEYERVYAAKRAILDVLFKTFEERHLRQGGRRKPATERGRAFATYIRREGEILERFALFQALAEHFHGQGVGRSWQEWPEAYRDPQSPEVKAFRATHASRIRFYQYLQWVTEEQVEAVARHATGCGMPVGLYHDLALGSDRTGSDAWMFRDVMALDADSGAPPDDFALEGQNWGLPPVNPHRLKASGYRMFIDLLRRNLRYGGALRLDHVMALFRLFWIPRGMPASAGAYVSYPFQDLLGILALESVRHQAVIVGEDLGTVPDEVREQLAAWCVLSYRVFYFERRSDGEWKPPAEFPAQALAVASTHDLPTLAGFWVAEDLRTRARLGLFPDEAVYQRALEGRQQDKARMIRALRAEGLLPVGPHDDWEALPDLAPEVWRAIHLYLARTPCWMMLANLDDLLGERAQANLPGTVERYPNWSRKTALRLEELRGDPRPLEIAALLNSLRS